MRTKPACSTNLVRFSALLVVVALFVPGPGCANQQYYRITDPQTNEVYYTQQIRHPNAGSATFQDSRTGKSVTLERMKIDTLDAQQYRAETSGDATNP